MLKERQVGCGGYSFPQVHTYTVGSLLPLKVEVKDFPVQQSDLGLCRKL